MENVAQKNEKSIPGAIKIDEKEVFVAIGVNSKGYCEILGVAEGSREAKESWSNFLRYLKGSGKVRGRKRRRNAFLHGFSQ